MKNKIKIIYAEDKEIFRKIIIQDLLPYDIETVAEASNGKELIRQINTNHDIVLLDLEMPIMDGNAAMDYLMEHHPETRIIIVSLHYEELLVEDYIKRGAKGYISKDIFSGDIKILVEAIRTVNAGGLYVHKIVPRKRKYTTVQKEIIPMICQGLTNNQIAEEKGVQVRAVERQRHKIYEKMEGGRAIDFYRYAFSKGLHFLKKIQRNK